MIDLVFGEIGLPRADIDWMTGMRRARAVREVLPDIRGRSGSWNPESTPAPPRCNTTTR